jgi:hypothetical protein
VLTFTAGVVGMLVSVLLAHAIPPMPLYSQMYKTANHDGDIILKTSGSVMLMVEALVDWRVVPFVTLRKCIHPRATELSVLLGISLDC